MCRNFVKALLIDTVVCWKSELHVLQDLVLRITCIIFFLLDKRGVREHHLLPA